MLNIYHKLYNDQHFQNIKIETTTKCIPFFSVCGHHIFPEKLILYSPGVENLKRYATAKKQRRRNGSNGNICKVLSIPIEHLGIAKHCGLEKSLKITTFGNFFLSNNET